MQIHNFFSDVLLSVRTLFDNYIFEPKTIKSYQFNLSNRSLVLSEYNTTFELPAAIVSLTSELFPQGLKTNVAQQLITDNINVITVVYNSTTNASLKLQEQLTQIDLMITINCESQLEAKELEFRIKQYLPLNKWIQFLKFSSFLEFPQNLMDKYNFDHLNHDLINLFTKIDRNTGKPIYCYSVHYEPMIMLGSISPNISDMGQRSFSVDINLSYLLQMPMFLFCDKGDKTIERVNFTFDQVGEDPICSIPSIPLIPPQLDGSLYTRSIIRETIIIRDIEQYIISILDDFINSDYLEIIKQIIHDLVLSALKEFKISVDDLINYYFDRIITNPYLRFLLFHEPPFLTLDQILYLLVSGLAFNYYLYLLLQKDLKLSDIRNYINNNEFTNDGLYMAIIQKLIDKAILQKYISFIDRLNQFNQSMKICIKRTEIMSSILSCQESDMRLNLIDNTGKIRHDIEILDITDEFICFRFTLEDFNQNLKPSLVSPVLFQVIEDRIFAVKDPEFSKKICKYKCN